MDDTHERIKALIDSLPVLSPSDLADSDDSCPICLMSFMLLFQDSNPGAGVTKLTACDHVFCRKDLIQWIESWHGSCPTCRNSFLDILPPSESDDESSDGGEYIPNEQEEEPDDDDDFFIDTDGFSDAADFAADPMELELNVWEDGDDSSDADMEDEDMNGTERELPDEDSSSISDDGNNGASDEDGDVGVALDMGVNDQNENENSILMFHQVEMHPADQTRPPDPSKNQF